MEEKKTVKTNKDNDLKYRSTIISPTQESSSSQTESQEDDSNNLEYFTE